MNKRTVVAAVLGVVLVVGLVLIWRRPGRLEVSLSAESPVKDGVELYLSYERYQTAHTLPYSVELQPGRYELYLSATNAVPTRQKVLVRPGGSTKATVRLERFEPNGEQTEITPTDEEVDNNPYFKLFPYYDSLFEVRAELDRDEEGKLTIKGLTIIPHVAPAPTDTEQDIQKQKEANIAAAKAWLKDNGVPDSIPIEVDSAY